MIINLLKPSRLPISLGNSPPILFSFNHNWTNPDICPTLGEIEPLNWLVLRYNNWRLDKSYNSSGICDLRKLSDRSSQSSLERLPKELGIVDVNVLEYAMNFSKPSKS